MDKKTKVSLKDMSEYEARLAYYELISADEEVKARLFMQEWYKARDEKRKEYEKSGLLFTLD